jgi:hypothetical protein
MAEWRTGSINLMAGTGAMQHAMADSLHARYYKNMTKALQEHCKDTILATSIRNGKRFLGSNGCICAATATLTDFRPL